MGSLRDGGSGTDADDATEQLHAADRARVTPTRLVHHGDGVAWLARTPLPDDHAIVTSLPDLSEVRSLDAAGWRRWFIDAVALACRQVSDESVAVFFQTDVKRDGRWIDKGFLAALGAEAAGSHLLWHKVVCRAPVGTVTPGRPSYAHLLCFSRARRIDPARSFADVLPRLGEMTWARAMGVEACAATCRFLQEERGFRTVVDPFCGVGTMLAVANAFGFDSVGVELSAKRAAQARALVLDVGVRSPP